MARKSERAYSQSCPHSNSTSNQPVGNQIVTHATCRFSNRASRVNPAARAISSATSKCAPMASAVWASEPKVRASPPNSRYQRKTCSDGQGSVCPRFSGEVLISIPLLPDDLVCFLIGLSPLSIPSMLALAAFGRRSGCAGVGLLAQSGGALGAQQRCVSALQGDWLTLQTMIQYLPT